MSLKEEQCNKVCRILDDVLANRPTERDSLIVATRSAFSALSEPHWIPVTERLPEVSGEYLVTVKWVTGESDVDVYEYDARHKTWNDGESAGGERAVAWCNLPEPFKGVTGCKT